MMHHGGKRASGELAKGEAAALLPLTLGSVGLILLVGTSVSLSRLVREFRGH